MNRRNPGSSLGSRGHAVSWKVSARGFGTEWSEVQILSPRPVNPASYVVSAPGTDTGGCFGDLHLGHAGRAELIGKFGEGMGSRRTRTPGHRRAQYRSPVKLTGEVSRIEKGFSLDAQMDYSGRLECSRCLASYPFENSEDFSLVLRKRPALGSEEVALRSEELDEFFYDDPVVSVEPIAEERIQMAVPMKPLCREDCRGLCPRCGQDLNVTAYGCVVETEDPRWEVLRVLKKV